MKALEGGCAAGHRGIWGGLVDFQKMSTASRPARV